ncbi:Alpha-glucuronidase [Xylanimonas cellulosilytica DSM 15894]|uniref:Alpha-glucuronidase n=1 Tax=Xylanimonas cellulosilytica (strain DSM 15894 / JCM 12276 / CECT 5975 / KCTC 9989 / LMG 20990 / NBRC 107835 / XIL07) TaxID=446471 RepID=D1BVD9_XYLCX|nr:alpha-glucuronidase [Xylanimonas cellulosilytica]ACZ29410.1 Alpha-glucuronidase [Xylanimonas cellulosilytica DSM 15894]
MTTAQVDPAVHPAAHPAWLPEAAFAPLGSRRIAVEIAEREWSRLEAEVAATVRAEVEAAVATHGGAVVTPDDAPDLVLAVIAHNDRDAEAFTVARTNGVTRVTAATPRGLLYGLFHVVRLGEAAFEHGDLDVERHAPATSLRMLDHWDNIVVHPAMGQVERGYSGGSIFYDDGVVREDLSRVAQYARLLAASGINRVAINNVNVGPLETRLIDDLLPDVVRIADVFRPYGITTHVSVSWASPVRLRGLPTSDPFSPEVRQWWAGAADRVWAAIPDFGGFVIKADSEGQPGPFAYGRTHADGANMLAAAVAPHGGLIHWRAFVYNHEQDWRDRKTDRAKAAFQHFAPYDGTFADNVIVQIKHGPLDFQVREATSPAIAAMPNTRVAAEFQVTTEYLGHQKHAVYLGRQWSELLSFPYWGEGSATMADIAVGRGPGGHAGGFAAVSNVGDDVFWTGHPFSQANLYAWGRLTWDPTADPIAILDEWTGLTFPGAPAEVRSTIHTILDESWETYEMYTAPLGVCFMVYPHTHYGPSPDGYEYTPWGTYHFADRDGVGVDRTVATGTGYTAQYPEPWSSVYESVETCPDELVLFFHHVPYTHVLHSGKTVIQHVYDTHFDGLERVRSSIAAWEAAAGEFPADLAARVTDRFAEQLRSTTDWRDIINTYFLRKSGIPDAQGRTIY